MIRRASLSSAFLFICISVLPHGASSLSVPEGRPLSRRRVAGMLAAGWAAGTTHIAPAHAGSKMAPAEALSRIQFEMENPDGGFAYMKQQIDAQEFVKLLEFTKTYDQNLRKTALGGLKSIVIDSNRATELANAVTFDLIGINRNSRPGSENADGARQYYEQLVGDVNEFLALERKAIVEE